MLFICSPSKRVSWVEQQVNTTHLAVFYLWESILGEWTSRVNPSLGQLDHLTQWVNKAVIPNKPVNEKATSKIRKIMLIKLTCIECFWNVESKNRIGPKKKSITINRFFHGSLQFLYSFELDFFCILLFHFLLFPFYAPQYSRICHGNSVCLSASLSVRPSVIRVLCIKTAERIIEILSPSDRPIFLDFLSPRVVA